MKIVGPLHSLGATGKFGGAVFYFGGKYSRQYVVPANPQTAGQMNQRQIFQATGPVTSGLNSAPVFKAALQANVATMQGEPDYRWASQSGKSQDSRMAASIVTFDLMAAPDQAFWQAVAVAWQQGLTDTNLVNTTDPPISAGAALFNMANVSWYNLIDITAGLPDNTNYAAWGTVLET